jgi:hypothetical protein
MNFFNNHIFSFNRNGKNFDNHHHYDNNSLQKKTNHLSLMMMF